MELIQTNFQYCASPKDKATDQGSAPQASLPTGRARPDITLYPVDGRTMCKGHYV